MELKTLRYFAKIIEMGSLSRAAHALFVAQPALSHQIASLEKELGVRLLDRSPKGITPTAAGMTLYRHALSVLRQTEQIKQQLQAEDDNVSGEVSFGIPSSTAVVLAMPLLKAVMTRYPKIKLEINENTSGLLSEWLTLGRLDLAILFTAGPLPSLQVQHLLDEDLCLVFPVGEVYQSARPQGLETISLRAIKNQALVVSSKTSGLRQVIEAAFSEAGIEPKVIAELSVLHTLKAAALEGIAATILPLSAVSEEWHAGRLNVKRIVDPTIVRPLSLCSNSRVPQSAAVEAVRTVAVEVINRLTREGTWPVAEAGLAPPAGALSSH